MFPTLLAGSKCTGGALYGRKNQRLFTHSSMSSELFLDGLELKAKKLSTVFEKYAIGNSYPYNPINVRDFLSMYLFNESKNDRI